MASRSEIAGGLRACLLQLSQEASDNGFPFCALHLKVVVLELDDVLETESLRTAILAGDEAGRTDSAHALG